MALTPNQSAVARAEGLGAAVATTFSPAPNRVAVDRPLVYLADVIRVFRSGTVETIALRGVDLEVREGEFVALMGRSGSGKSTLLNLIAGGDRPTAGRVIVDGVDLARADEHQRAAMRGRRVGIVYQSSNLVPFLTLRENVELAANLAGQVLPQEAVAELLGQFGLSGRAEHRPGRLSGGEQQRAGLAVVLAAGPALLLGDEITGELDHANSAHLLDVLAAARRTASLTVVLATHDVDVAARADRVVRLRDGRVDDSRVAA